MSDTAITDKARTLYVAVAPVMRLTEASASSFGTTKRAIEHRISRGVWLEGKEYHRAPDGTIWLIVKGIEAWVAAGRASK